MEALFAHRVYLKYAQHLEDCIGKLSGLNPKEMIYSRTVVDLMTQTVVNHKRHESTELRYVTLMHIMMSYNPGWEPTAELNDLWAIVDQNVSSDISPDEFRRQAYNVIVSLPWVPSSYGLFDARSFDEGDAIHSDIAHRAFCLYGIR